MMSFFGSCCPHSQGEPLDILGVEPQGVGFRDNQHETELVEPQDADALKKAVSADEAALAAREAEEHQTAEEAYEAAAREAEEQLAAAAAAKAKAEEEAPPKETEEQRLLREEREEEAAIKKMEERMQAAKKKKKQSMSLHEWEVTITKPKSGGSLGLDLLMSTKANIVVNNVNENGIVMQFNDTQAEEGQAILPGTVIVSVNGATEKTACLAALKDDPVLNLKVKRVLSELVVPLDEGGKLGLDLDTDTVEVKEVKNGGRIHQYNMTCEIGYEVVPTDLVVAVNKIKGEPEKLMKSIRGATGDMKLTFARLGGERNMKVNRMPTLLGEDGEALVES